MEVWICHNRNVTFSISSRTCVFPHIPIQSSFNFNNFRFKFNFDSYSTILYLKFPLIWHFIYLCTIFHSYFDFPVTIFPFYIFFKPFFCRFEAVHFSHLGLATASFLPLYLECVSPYVCKVALSPFGTWAHFFILPIHRCRSVWRVFCQTSAGRLHSSLFVTCTHFLLPIHRQLLVPHAVQTWLSWVGDVRLVMQVGSPCAWMHTAFGRNVPPGKPPTFSMQQLIKIKIMYSLTSITYLCF